MVVFSRIIFFISFLTIGNILVAQELNCRVQVISSQVQGTNKQKYETMQTSIYEFVNNTKWTNHVYSIDERIECSFIITIQKEISADEFEGQIQIISSRPIFNSTYYSNLFNYVDKNFKFKYVEFQTLDFNENTHSSNLTSILAYYVYVVLGYDYDTYSFEGGDVFFKKAEQIVNNAQNEKEKGWKAFESQKNRYWLIENILNDKYADFRSCLYRYHRLGLDVMSEKADEGRSEIAECLTLAQNVHRQRPGLFILQMFFETKVDELVSVFSESFPDEKNRVYNILKEVDPANSAKYAKIRETN